MTSYDIDSNRDFCEQALQASLLYVSIDRQATPIASWDSLNIQNIVISENCTFTCVICDDYFDATIIGCMSMYMNHMEYKHSDKFEMIKFMAAIGA